MKPSNLSALFEQKFGIRASFYLTEEDFAAQRFLYAGLPQLQELAEMKKEGRFDFETVLLIQEKSPGFSEVPEEFKGGGRQALRSAITGFVMVERTASGDPAVLDTGHCLVFTPAVSDRDTKEAFYAALGGLIFSENPGRPIEQAEISEAELADDIRAYYAENARSFFEESGGIIPPYDAVYSEARVSKAKATLQRIKNHPKVAGFAKDISAPERKVLEVCCGNGMSSLALYAEEISPITVDVNAEEICIGLSHGVLKPEKTIVMDATMLSRNLDAEQFDFVIGFMIGTVYEFNKEMWFSIADECIKILKPGGFLFFTLREEEEAQRMADHFKEKGIDGEIIDNREKETNYDSWIYGAQKEFARKEKKVFFHKF